MPRSGRQLGTVWDMDLGSPLLADLNGDRMTDVIFLRTASDKRSPYPPLLDKAVLSLFRAASFCPGAAEHHGW